jgi:phospholipid/cholesterol/gamma-HCH transport system permease protein
MLLSIVEKIGDVAIKSFLSIYEAVKFAVLCIVHMMLPSSYNPAMLMVLTRQVYFTAVQIIPFFTFLAFLFGTVIIGFVVSLAFKYSLQDQIGSIIIHFTLDEFAPFFTALLISLRSSTAVNTEIAVMKVNHELKTLEHFDIDLIDYLFIPRIVAGMLSVTSLSLIFAIVMLTSGYIFSFFYLSMDLNAYIKMLINAITIQDLNVLLFKSLAFGFVIMLIPIYSGLKTMQSYSAIPISVLNGMMKLFIAIFAIEVISLLLQSL